ncbi:hypothetical protein FB560_2897 [Microbacterium saperdae]|uniref:Uncharacterized protein n=1 Tax=Microbacterium saperdae TaxID=69368 RepID=A0A543BR01_9MICO|nr:hypothetical protein FB560_2897 [Microbacterium saperdae]
MTAQLTTKVIDRPYLVPSSHPTSMTVAAGLANVLEIEKGRVIFGATSIGSATGMYRSWASLSATGRRIAERAVSVPTLRSTHRFGPSLSTFQRTGGKAGGPSTRVVVAAAAAAAEFTRSTSTSIVSTCLVVISRAASLASVWALAAAVCASVASSCALSALLFARKVKPAMTRVATTPMPVSQTIHQSAADATATIASAVGLGVGFTHGTLSASSQMNARKPPPQRPLRQHDRLRATRSVAEGGHG